MKYLSTLLLFSAFAFAFVSCNKSEEPETPINQSGELSVLEIASDSVILNLKSNNLSCAAFICEEADIAEGGEITPAHIFSIGTVVDIQNGDNPIVINNLVPLKDYVVTMAVKTVKNEIADTILNVKFTTKDIEIHPSGELSVLEIASDSAILNLKSMDLSYAAFICEKAVDAEGGIPEYIFEIGDTVDIHDGDNHIVINDLMPNNDYVVTMAVKTVKDEIADTIFTVKFTTGDYEKNITIVEVKYDGYVVHLKVPDYIKNNDSVAIRYNTACLPMYNLVKQQGYADADMLLQNGSKEPVSQDTNIYIDEEHRVITDEDGEKWELWDPIVPGEPNYFIVGEFSWGESPYGWGDGFYIPKFDYEGWWNTMGGDEPWSTPLAFSEDLQVEDSFWTGFHQREFIIARKPDLLNAKVNIEVTNLIPINATLRFTPEDGVKQYVTLVMDEETYDMVLNLLDNNEDYLQWFTTSCFAFTTLYAQSFEEEIEMDLSGYCSIEPGTKIEVLTVAMGDEEGTEQNFQKMDITIPDYTKPAPVVTVTAIDNPEGTESPYEIWFNVKAPNADLASAKYIANYTREFEVMFNKGYDMQSLINQMGNPLSEEDVASINSPEGFNIMFTSRADAETMLGVIGYNDEGRGSEAASAKNKTIPVPALDPVDSPLFTELKGDWTASATLAKYDNNTGEWIPDETPITFKVHIDNALAEFPATLTDDIYALYPDKSEEEVDAMYGELLERREIYNTRLKEQNSLVCTGFGIDPLLDYQSPYDLFISKTYSGYDIESLFYDFGPKWNMQINSDGTVSIQVNINFLDPLTNWHSTYGRKDICYLVPTCKTTFIAGPTDPNEKWPKIPVTVSEDNDTITLNSFTAEDNDGKEDIFYPNVMTLGYYGFTTLKCGKIVSEITLTRGWTEQPAQTNVKAIRNSYALKMKPANNFVYKPATVPISRTGFSKLSKPIKKVNGPKHISCEEFMQGMKELCKKYYKLDR